MKPSDAQALALRLISEHGLAADGWQFRWNSAKKLCGRTKWRPGPHGWRPGWVELSRHFVKLNAADQVRETILHELAHAIAGPEAGHGPVWKAVATRIGARPNRCASGEDLVVPPGRWRLVCQSCRCVVRAHVHRRNRNIKLYRATCCENSTGNLQYEEHTND